VTLVEFSDFQCPFCKQSQATLKQLQERYPGKLKLVYRDSPLDQLHPAGPQRLRGRTLRGRPREVLGVS
jgi:protein-disulfide isomerase